ncbi:MAG: hypothetical protein NTZ42_02620 [Candidatus Gribaldobacteria bacterium]|nr:hypothetical protein [Candidatus Gribaldobacteria bacterium]
MESLIKADIFFFISSVATIVVTFLVSILLFYLIKAGRNLQIICQALKDNFKESEEFVADLKERLEDNIIFRIFFPPSRKKRHSGVKK